MERRIVCAAMRCRNTGKIVCSVRHWDKLVRHVIPNQQAAHDFDDEQGFVDNQYNFLDRHQAWKVAEAAGQIIRRCGGDTANDGTLYSENLY